MKPILSTASGVVLALGLLASGPVAAGPFTIYDVEINKGEQVTLTAPISDSFAFGQIVLTTSVGTIDAWCIDLFHDIYLGGGQDLSYTTGTIATNGDGQALTALQTREIAGLIVNGNALLSDGGGTPNDSLATQLAIWSVENPGVFTFSGGATVTAETNALIASAPSMSGDGVALISLGGQQGLATATPSYPTASSIAEPATLAIISASLLGLGLFRRGRRSRRPAR